MPTFFNASGNLMPAYCPQGRAPSVHVENCRSRRRSRKRRLPKRRAFFIVPSSERRTVTGGLPWYHCALMRRNTSTETGDDVQAAT